jgi:hypothetical protein
MIEATFGINSNPYKRFMRMVYWMHKFKNKQPWPLPLDLPTDTLELALLAIGTVYTTVSIVPFFSHTAKHV